MSSLNMCVKLILCFVLAAAVDSHVLKPQVYPLPPQGMVVEVVLKNKLEQAPITRIAIDIDELLKKVVVSNLHGAENVLKKHLKSELLPAIENRNGIKVGHCPAGFIRRGGFCFPEDD